MLCRLKFNHPIKNKRVDEDLVLAEFVQIHHQAQNSGVQVNFFHVFNDFKKIFIFKDTDKSNIISYYKLLIGPWSRINRVFCEN
jgi:hypothetical protein